MDEETIQAARAGDRLAQAELLRSMQDRWFRFCISLLGDADLARDATQETALRFLRELPRFAGRSALATWSMGIALNIVREMKRQRSRADGRATPEPSSGSPPAADKLEQAEEWAAVRELVQRLPDRQREAVVLRFFEEMSIEETAEAMSCAPGTVKATVHQALRALRQALAVLAI